MFGLLGKCIVLIGIIHGIRMVSRRIGPRASGWILGLPSSTGILLVLCGWERGSGAATAMAEASLVGLAAAVALPVAYVQAIGRGWRLAGALGAAIAVYLLVAAGLGSRGSAGLGPSLLIATGAIALASYLAGRARLPSPGRCTASGSPRWTASVRTAIPAGYVLLAGVLGSAASPSWAGLVSTFPSMSVAVLIVTHLEGGPAEAGLVARALPTGNLSTLVFLAVFRFGCPMVGLGWGMFGGYVAALANLAAIELVAGRWVRDRLRRTAFPGPRVRARLRGVGLRIDAWSAARRLGRLRPARPRGFAPRVEILPC